MIEPALINILNFPARFADKVVMMALISTKEIILFAIGQKNAGYHPGFSQFIKNTIDRGKSEAVESGLDLSPDFIRSEIG
jgi:hypothetical protein